ncbi:glycoside hydrolase family 32 protein [Cesiribacter andamanensis]|uniref:Levanase n=1 Tax=Cesiribacter andamanensis AMV16 TaxID=1279009 RepID=M7N7U3_9BACT|nr:glycoside hydrolase family 32 protein [Cesiribacter andamanensis]EMR04678.1 Levanase precursor [Cesiribacter andamanensis AMV16]
MERLYFFTLCFILSSCVTNPEGQVNTTSKANEEREHTYRPHYHLSPPEGWMGDPSGLVFHEGLYHFYYWRHAASKDLVNWSHYPKAFKRQDSIGQMSGSVVVDYENTSGFGSKESPPFVAIYSMLRPSDGRQMQGIAYSTDKGNTYTHYDKNPVIDIGSTEFRDPQVFWHAPSNKWLMVIALADARKVQFYSSPNLKDWTFVSDFGPVGAEGGVWECPDLFPLPVDGDPNNIKWVLEVDVQPVGGQYFLGSFDGERFVVDPDFQKQLQTTSYVPKGKVLFDFEKGLEGWRQEGEAFSASPTKGALELQSVIIGYQGQQLVNSYYRQDKTVGRITSPAFTIDQEYINFMIGGGYHPDSTAIRLLIDGKVVRSTTGANTETMRWSNWPVKEWRGKTARIEIVDQHTGGFGHINVDHIMQSNEPAVHKREVAPWIDYGPDFYAVRSWQDAPQNGKSRVWIAWMGNWLYAHDLPTKGWKGMQSVPRELSLKAFPDGVRLVQQPVGSLKQLRKKHVQVQDLVVKGIVPVNDFQPDRNAYELVVEFDLGEAKHVGLHIAAGEKNKTIIGYREDQQQLYVDRTNSGKVGFNPSFPLMSEGPLSSANGTIRLRIFVDQCSVEVFGGEGETVISSLIFPEPEDLEVRLFSEGGSARVLKLDAWMLDAATIEKVEVADMKSF